MNGQWTLSPGSLSYRVDKVSMPLLYEVESDVSKETVPGCSAGTVITKRNEGKEHLWKTCYLASNKEPSRMLSSLIFSGKLSKGSFYYPHFTDIQVELE